MVVELSWVFGFQSFGPDIGPSSWLDTRINKLQVLMLTCLDYGNIGTEMSTHAFYKIECRKSKNVDNHIKSSADFKKY